MPPSLATARADALIKRARLRASIAEAQYRLTPATIVSGITDDLRDKAEDGFAAVRRHPAVVVSVATGLIALLARKPIIRLFRAPAVVPPILPAPVQGTQS